MLPTVPTPDRTNADALPPGVRFEDFTDQDFRDACAAGRALAEVLDHVSRMYLVGPSLPGVGHVVDEIALVRNGCEFINAALWEARHQMRLIERRARRRARQRARSATGEG